MIRQNDSHGEASVVAHERHTPSNDRTCCSMGHLGLVVTSGTPRSPYGWHLSCYHVLDMLSIWSIEMSSGCTTDCRTSRQRLDFCILPRLCARLDVLGHTA